MGATRESNWSDGILEASFGFEEVASCEGDDICAKVSPGKRIRAHRIATRDRPVTPFDLEVMGPLSVQTESIRISGRTGAEVSAHFFSTGSNAGAACGCTVGPLLRSVIWQKVQAAGP